MTTTVADPTPQSYRKEPFSLERMLIAFEHCFNVPRQCIPTAFREHAQRIMEKHYPRLYCSPARAVLEGRVAGVPSPIPRLHPQWAHRVRHVLALMDLLETMIQESREVQDEPHPVVKVFGQPFMEANQGVSRSPLVKENDNATSDKETEKSDGGRVQRPLNARNPKKGRV